MSSKAAQANPNAEKHEAMADMVITGFHLPFPPTAQNYKPEMIDAAKRSLDKILVSGLSEEYWEKMTRLIGNARTPDQLNEEIVRLGLKTADDSSHINYCATESSQCKPLTPYTRPEISYFFGATAGDGTNLTPERPIPVDKAAIFNAAAMLAYDNPELGKKLAKEYALLKGPDGKIVKQNPPVTDPADAAILQKGCDGNTSNKIIDIGYCAQGGLAYGLTKRGVALGK